MTSTIQNSTTLHIKPNVYFVGAGGIGMSALVRYCLSKGHRVGGYDRADSHLLRQLAAEGAVITLDDSAEAIPAEFRNPADTLVVYTPAVPASHPGLSWFRNNGFEVVKRAELLGKITRSSLGICFAGTHGKTTTSSMAAHILHSSPVGCNAFLGGILRNYDSNLLLSPTSPYSVIEADEFDRSFHHLSPHIAVITATDPDHLDIYGTEEAYLESFAHFTELIRPGGTLILHTGLKLKPRPAKGVRVWTYGRSEGDFHAANIRRDAGTLTFDLVTPHGIIRDLRPGVPVDINIDNTIAAVAGVYATGALDITAMRAAVESFLGPKRRFEVVMREPGSNGRVIIDDYAHHPDEIRAAITSVKALYPDRRVSVVFQPHLYTRTRDFAPEFAAALDLADDVTLVELYPAREKPIPGISEHTIAALMKNPAHVTVTKPELDARLRKGDFDVLLNVGAGDVSDMLPPIAGYILSHPRR
ncbi:MAG: UDP-N-acetylmuramate--L-alanine ligase [Candidatus Amulumruptor caecigallinarius]|nr:UDP-N-acetylmuramate--L-alanine ligase [Candidatus Amulumruptor caecigallinarius]MCM1396478.1 UDP-N-acetylmuramate--L-alanine ligase [Candidatus Amulumruptor caecigallinarius]MCM1453465.1 UDP-N-acetylmuramate--L-alanine ligase [bacterium]